MNLLDSKDIELCVLSGDRVPFLTACFPLGECSHLHNETTKQHQPYGSAVKFKLLVASGIVTVCGVTETCFEETESV